MSMFRKFCMPVLLVAVVAMAFANPSEALAAKKKTPEQNFKDYTYTGWVMGYYGWLYADYARSIAISSGYDDGDTSNVLLYAKDNAYYSFYYGYYGWEYGYSDWVQNASDLAVASRNYEQGIYDYLNENYYPYYKKQLQPMMDAMYYQILFMQYAEIYYDYAVGFVTPKATAKK